MAGNKKPRKAYRPGKVTVIANTLQMAARGSSRLPSVVVRSYIDPLRELLGQIQAGQEAMTEWRRMRDAAMVCEALMETGAADVSAHARTELVTGWQLAIESAVARRRRAARDGLTASEREQLTLLLTWYEALLGDSTQAQLLSAQRHALHRIRSELGIINKAVAGKAPPCGLGRELLQIAEMENAR